MCKQQTYVTIPYNDKGMLYDLQQVSEHALLPPNLSANTVFDGQYLYLFATDQLSEKTASELTVNEMFIGNAAYLRYDTKEKTFELFFFNGDPTSFVFR
jgi:hypothetical protein